MGLLAAALAVVWTLHGPTDAFDDNTTSHLSVETDQGAVVFFCENGKIDIAVAPEIPIGRYPVLRGGRVRADKERAVGILFTVSSPYAGSTTDGIRDGTARTLLSSKTTMGFEIDDSDELPVRMTIPMTTGAKERQKFLAECK